MLHLCHFYSNSTQFLGISFLLYTPRNLRCFTLMSLASSAANVTLIRRSRLRSSLELALETQSRDVGVMISTLLKRLKFVYL
jgi:hypothetical protein